MLKAFSKKTLSLLLALCMVLACGLITASAATPSVTAAVDTSGLASNKVLAMTTTDALNGFRSPWKCFGGAKNQIYSIDLWLPEIEAGSEIRLFSLNLLDSGTSAHNDSIIIKDGVFYVAHGSTIKENSESKRTITRVCEKGLCDEGVEGGVCGEVCQTPLPALSAKTWYTVGYTYDILSGAYTATVTEKETGTVFATASGTRPEVVDAVTGAGTTRLLTILKAKNFTGKLLIDNIIAKAVNDEGKPTAYSAFSTDIESGKIGDNNFVGEANNTNGKQGVVVELNSSLDCPVASEADYLIFGKADSLSPAPIMLTFSDVDPAALTAESIKLMENDMPLSAEKYMLDVLDNVATITFTGLLDYEAIYGIDMTELGITKEISFKTPDDPFVTTGTAFFNGDGNDIYGVPAQGNGIKAQVTFDNGDFEARNYLVLLVLYEGDKMVAVTSAQGTIEEGALGAPVETPVLTVPAGENLTASVLVWNDWQGSYAMSEANALE